MPDFVYDNTNLPGGTANPKSDKYPLGVGENPTKYVVATDWNTVCDATVNLRAAILSGSYHGLAAQGATPDAPAAGTALLFTRTNGLATPNTRLQLCVVWSDGSVAVLLESPAY